MPPVASEHICGSGEDLDWGYGLWETSYRRTLVARSSFFQFINFSRNLVEKSIGILLKIVSVQYLPQIHLKLEFLTQE